MTRTVCPAGLTGLVLMMAACAACGDGGDGAAVGGGLGVPRPELVKIPAGTAALGFGTGVPSSPVHVVTITEDFEIGKFEITNEEYAGMLNEALRRGMLAGDYERNGVVRNRQGDSQRLLHLGERIHGIGNPIQFDPGRRQFVVEAGRDRHPVVYVTWYGAAFYCKVLSEIDGLQPLYELADWSLDLAPAGPGYRLPTEAEWEYVARFDENNMDPDRRRLVWGWPYAESADWPSPDDEDLKRHANYNDPPALGGTKPVGSYESGKTVLGVYDMAGNVSEWIQDYYAPYQAFSQTNPVENTAGIYRQRRGGGWLKYANNFLYTFYRTDTNYEYVYYVDLGFRVVKSGMAPQAIGVTVQAEEGG